MARRAIGDRIRSLDEIAEELVSRLESAPDADTLAKLFHSAVEQIRMAEFTVRP
ncbi:hypothetical protein [Edaphobacter modestus]|uniref:hypothetical protein n=1 Tax=Edaphobacter modestus TaxID=388466 RepID=UPI0013EE7A60|nr:hypothetical protein [Edaphobacter modestus]